MGYTKGPWKTRKIAGAGWPGQRGYAIDFNEDQEQVVDFVYEEGDAHLIKAAPDMFEVIDDLLNLADDSMVVEWFGREFVDKARAAYARAKGEAE